MIKRHLPFNFIYALLFTAPIYANETGNTQRGSNDLLETDDEELLVTARKREESLLEVPISVVVFNEEALNKPTVVNLESLDGLTPNMEFGSSPPVSGTTNAATVFIRGIGQNDFLATNDPGVGIYLDGVYIARSVGAVLRLDDIERVEVLRGPQGTLFGKNSIGGAIQVISRKPSDTFQSRLGVTLGEFNRRDTSASFEGPITENLSGRLSLLEENRDGYVERPLADEYLGDVNSQAAKGVLHWELSGSSELMLSVDHTRQRQNGAPEIAVEIAESRDAATLLGILPGQWTSYETFNVLIAPQFQSQWDSRWVPTDNRFLNYGTGEVRDDIDVTGVALTGRFDLTPSLSLTSVTGYRTMEGVYARDADASPLNYGQLKTEDEQSQYSQELRLNGRVGDSLSWTTGIFYFKEDIDNRQDVIIMQGLFEATAGTADATFDVTNILEVNSSALFGQASWDIDNRWSVTGGLRFTREEKDFFVDIAAVNIAAQVIGPVQRPQDAWTNLLPMLSVDYRFSDASLAYISYSEGFKSGGYNGRLVNPPADPVTGEPTIDTFDPEEAESFELGFKQNFKNIFLQSSVFETNYTNLQVSVFSQGANNPITVTIDNAAKAQIRGAELEVQADIDERLIINFGAGYLDAKYQELEINTLLNLDAKLQKIPKWNFYLGAEQKVNLGRHGDLRLGLDASYKSKTYNDPLNTESVSQDGFALYNAFVTWEADSTGWVLSFFGNNLSDEEYFLSGVSDLGSFGASGATLSRGREFGFELQYTFK